MANRKITVLNPAGYQELFQSGDNLIVDGAINLQSNGLTGVPTPSVNLDAANKSYVDTGVNANSNSISTNTSAISANTSDISALDTRLTTAEGDITSLSAPNNSQVDITGSSGITVTGGSFTLNQAGDATIDIEGPDLSGFLSAPSTNGSFVVTQAGSTTSYTDVIDGGSY